MDESTVDFLDEIFTGEERIYHEVYGNTFREAQNSIPDSVSDDVGQKECERVYLEGVHCGAKLGSELCSLYGLVTELLERWALSDFIASLSKWNYERLVDLLLITLSFLKSVVGAEDSAFKVVLQIWTCEFCEVTVFD